VSSETTVTYAFITSPPNAVTGSIPNLMPVISDYRIQAALTPSTSRTNPMSQLVSQGQSLLCVSWTSVLVS